MFNNNEIIVRFNEFVYDKKLKHICDVYPIVPAKKIENSWWQIMKSHYDIFLSSTRKEFKSAAPTLKYCPAIYDFTNYGYIVPAWQDIQFRVDETGLIEWIVPPTMQQVPNITIHNREQVSTCPILDDTTNVGLVILKLISPWYISTPKGTSLFLCKPFYHYSNEFDVCPGVLDSDMDNTSNNAVNAMLRFNVRNKTIHIKAGQPLIQLIPFKRMNWKLKHLEMDKNFIDSTEKDLISISTRFKPSISDKDSMTKYRHDDSNKKFE